MGEEADRSGEGKQLQLFRLCFRKCIEDIEGSIPVDDFAELFHPSSSSQKRKLDRLISCEFKFADVRETIDNMIVSEDIDNSLKKRDRLLEEQAHFGGTVAWRPSGSVVDDIRAHDLSVYKAKNDQLAVMCEREEKDLNEVFLKVVEARKDFHENQLKFDRLSKMINQLRIHTENQEEGHVKVTQTLS